MFISTYIAKGTYLVFIHDFDLVFKQDFPSKVALQAAKCNLHLIDKENIVPEVGGV